MSRTTDESSPRDDAIAIAGPSVEAREILLYILKKQTSLGRASRAHMTFIMLDMVECYDENVVALFKSHDEVFEDMYFELGKRTGFEASFMP